jgi:hypothetical protein
VCVCVCVSMTEDECVVCVRCEASVCWGGVVSCRTDELQQIRLLAATS